MNVADDAAAVMLHVVAVVQPTKEGLQTQKRDDNCTEDGMG